MFKGREKKKGNAATNKTLLWKKNSDLQKSREKKLIKKKETSSTIFNDAIVGISADSEASI